MVRGFSLVELSIVLVILGLLTGGILAGQSLIRAAELRSVSSDIMRYKTALHSFRDKYFAIAGDMNNATRFWGDDNAACADAAITNGTPGTCNGDGDGLVEWASGASQTGEAFQLWKQLTLAGLVEGSFSGLASSGGGAHATPGTNVPSVRISSGGATLAYYNTPGNAYNFAMNYGDQLTIGSASAAADTSSALLKPEEVWNIDAKMDDGKPGLGIVISTMWDTCSLATSFSDLSAEYDLSVSTVSCAIRVRNMI